MMVLPGWNEGVRVNKHTVFPVSCNSRAVVLFPVFRGRRGCCRRATEVDVLLERGRVFVCVEEESFKSGRDAQLLLICPLDA